MLQAMPVVTPILVPFTVQEFLEGESFGYLEATVQPLLNEYLGLLPLTHNGR